ncbi:hypothetical protein DSCO28_55400 [Desulfosarcina ovata subsp. sediminis]|uniref:Uncharacterized protein n=1 Tax=Desulfosarcina ovata subsp. sediminis TaxID=885957 RepID=A0A5K7ZXT9_9BACT|nr:hypothetical protein DSCO28_55400 [Desulfosarcina ovata subsp. sediminis]
MTLGSDYQRPPCPGGGQKPRQKFKPLFHPLPGRLASQANADGIGLRPSPHCKCTPVRHQDALALRR